MAQHFLFITTRFYRPPQHNLKSLDKGVSNRAFFLHLCGVLMCLLWVYLSALKPAHTQSLNPDAYQNKAPLTGSEIAQIYYDASIHYQKGEYQKAYQITIARLDMTVFPPALLSLTAELAFRIGHHEMGHLITDRFAQLFPNHPDRITLALQSEYLKSNCGFITRQTGATWLLHSHATIPAQIAAKQMEILEEYQQACKAKNWQTTFQTHLTKRKASLPALPPKMLQINYTEDSILAGLCAVFGSPSCVGTRAFLLTSGAYRVDYLQTAFEIHLHKNTSPYTSHFSVSNDIYSLEGDAVHAVSPALESRWSYLLNATTRLGFGAQFEQFQSLSAASNNVHINHLKSFLSAHRKLPQTRWADRFKIELTHHHQYGDADPHHRYQIATQIEIKPVEKLTLSFEQQEAIQYASSKSLYGDMRSSTFATGAHLEINRLAQFDFAVGINIQFARTTHQASKTPIWLTYPHQQQIDHTEIKLNFTHNTLLIKPFIGLESIHSVSLNSLYDYRYTSVLFGFSSTFDEVF